MSMGPVEKYSKEIKALKKEISGLKKNLTRNEKALAETATLLVLKKSPVDLGGARGRMITEKIKQAVLKLISDACKAGARKRKAAGLLVLSLRTIQRWEQKGIIGQPERFKSCS